MTVAVTTKTVENLHTVNWPTPKVLAFSTTRFPPQHRIPTSDPDIKNERSVDVKKYPSEFDFFNLGTHVGDCLLSVENNRKILLNYLPSASKIQWLEQVHGNHVADVDEHSTSSIIADAVITRSKKVALAIMTADCLPILLADKNGKEIAAIHAGWRPLAKNIIKATIDKMQTSADDIVVWLGPCIGPKVFEVGKEVKEEFIANSTKLAGAFNPLMTNNPEKNATKYLVDLAMIAKLQLAELGVDKISATNACTFTQSKQYYSYRRDRKTGRMASIIALV